MHKNQVRAKVRIILLKKLTGMCRAADQCVLKKLSVGCICPVLQHGRTSSSTAAKPNTEKTDRIQS